MGRHRWPVRRFRGPPVPNAGVEDGHGAGIGGRRARRRAGSPQLLARASRLRDACRAPGGASRLLDPGAGSATRSDFFLRPFRDRASACRLTPKTGAAAVCGSSVRPGARSAGWAGVGSRIPGETDRHENTNDSCASCCAHGFGVGTGGLRPDDHHAVEADAFHRGPAHGGPCGRRRRSQWLPGAFTPLRPLTGAASATAPNGERPRTG